MGRDSTAATTTTTATITTTITRLKREEFRHTKHDVAFSKWRILIGPSDWADYSAQKEGAERYRVANLPEVAGSGVYEIGVGVWYPESGREAERVVVVYLGQADNVRGRLQEYGRCGSHLVVCGVDLFQTVFDRGFPIVYRWALMKSKTEAEKTESQLLEKFDYAWNKIGNGSRRPQDILTKMDIIASKTHTTSKMWKMLRTLRDQKVGIPIKAEKFSFDNESDPNTYDEKSGFFGRVFKLSRSRPSLVSPEPVKDSSQSVICGVTLSDGKICIEIPVEGRKRCLNHKGKKLNSKSMTKNLSNIICENQEMTKVLKPKSVIAVSLPNPGLVDICGVHFGDGKCCTRVPVKGRKRCEEHKGMRVDVNVSKLSSRDKWFNAKLA